MKAGFGTKPTNEELDARIESMCALIARGMLWGETKVEMRRQFGPLSHQTLSRYASRARARLLLSSALTRSDRLAIAVARYEGVIRDPASTPGVRIAAQTRIDKLLGLEAYPQKPSFPWRHFGPLD